MVTLWFKTLPGLLLDIFCNILYFATTLQLRKTLASMPLIYLNVYATSIPPRFCSTYSAIHHYSVALHYVQHVLFRGILSILGVSEWFECRALNYWVQVPLLLPSSSCFSVEPS